MRSKKQYDISKYEGYVKARVLSHYYRLPESVKSSIGVDDCVQDALLHIHEAININETYDKTRSKLTSYIYLLVESYFGALIKAHMRKKRATILIPIDIITKQPAIEENASNRLRLREAKDKVTELHLNASPALIDFIAANFYHPVSKYTYINTTPNDFKIVMHPYTRKPRKLKCTKGEVLTKRKQEFRGLAQRMGVTIDHYRLALQSELW